MYSKQNPEEIKKLFDKLAPKYDFLNDIISFGIHKKVKRRAIKLLPQKNYDKIVDLCTGTGDIVRLLAKKFPKSHILATDFSVSMLKLAEQKLKAYSNISFKETDINNLTFNPKTFDLCTIAFGLRNLPDANKAIKDINKILKQNGELLILEAVKPQDSRINPADFYFKNIMPSLASIFGVEKNAYQYLAKSRDDYPMHKEIEQYLIQNNFKIITKKEYCFNMFSLYITKKEDNI